MGHADDFVFHPDFLCECRLNIDCLSGEAGLELYACQAGYVVERTLPQPGQPELSLGDAIVAIGGMSLMGLDPGEVERRFGEARSRSATDLVTAPLAELTRWPFEVVQNELERLLNTQDRAKGFAPTLQRTSTC